MKEKIVIIAIIGLAFFLRVWQLDKVPPSASLDETSIGYNAFSILKTGADEYGTKFLFLLRAYDDWRPALYVYLVIPFVKVLGLNVLAVRLPSVILSVLTVAATFFLVKELFRKWEMRNGKLETEMGSEKTGFSLQDAPLHYPVSHIALLTSFLLAISPWHIYLSRLGHEVNAGLAFFIFAMLFIFGGKAYLTAIFFILSFVSYQSEKIFIPLMIFGMAIIYRKDLSSQWKKIIFISVLSFIILTPFIRETLQPNALIRFKGTSILEAKKEELAGKIGLERRFLMGQIIMKNYLLHFNSQWLFANSGKESHKIPNLGLFYLWEAPFMAIGLFYLLKNIKKSTSQLLLWWILVAPLPAALTTQAPHAMRTLQILPVPQILTAVGIILTIALIEKIKFSRILFERSEKFRTMSSRSARTIFLILVLCFLIFNFYFLYRNYFIVFPKEQSESFQYALKDTVEYVNQHQNEYSKIVFSNQDDLYQSYMFMLFYSQYDPKLYREQGGTKSGGFAETHRFGKFEFRPINRNQEKKEAKILYVGTTKELPNNYLKQFNYLDNKMGVRITNGQNL